MEYLIALTLTIIGIIINKYLTKNTRLMAYAVIFIYVVLLLAFRYRVGGDTISYMNNYKLAPSLSHISLAYLFSKAHYEPGLVFIMGLGKSFHLEFWSIQLILAFLTNIGIFTFIWMYSKNPFWGLLLYFYIISLYFCTEILRESVAVSFFLLNFKNLENKRWIQYYFLSLFSIFFHYSAIIILLFPFIKFLRMNIWFCLLIIGLFAVTPLVESLNNLLYLGRITEKISTYTEKADTNNINWRIGELIRVGLPVVGIIIAGKLIGIKPKFQPFLLLQLLLTAGAFAIPMIFSRFTSYTTILVIVSAANMIYSMRDRKILQTLFIIFIFSTQVLYIRTQSIRWYPYVSIFNPTTIREREIEVRKSFY